jgi:hypothetical protein
MLNGTFEEVGFGIANGSNYQGGPNTVVVAHYGDPVTTSTPPPPAPAPTPAPTPTPTPASTVESETIIQEEPAPVEESPPANTPPVDTTNETPTTQTPENEIVTETPKRFSNLDALISGQADWALYVTSAVALTLGFVYVYRHILFIHKTIVKGEDYLIHHPMLEASIVYALIWLLLAGSFGNVL